MMIRSILIVCACLIQSDGFAQSASQPSCRTSKPAITPAGKTYIKECGNRTEIFLNDKVILADDNQLFPEQSSNDSLIDVYHGGSLDPTTYCAARLYLLDFSKRPAKVIAFGVKNACNLFDWASWGKKRSVIALMHNVRFVYEDGRLRPPKADEKLWTSVEASHGSGPNIADYIVPFVEDISPSNR